MCLRQDIGTRKFCDYRELFVLLVFPRAIARGGMEVSPNVNDENVCRKNVSNSKPLT